MPNPLKPQSAPKARMPKAEILWTSTEDLKLDKLSSHKWSDVDFPVAVLPFPSAKAAKAFVKVANMIGDDRIQYIQGVIMHNCDLPVPIEHVEEVLKALSFPQAGGGK